MKSGKKGKAKNSGRLWTIILIAVALVGVAFLTYPAVSNWRNERVQSRAVAVYDEAVAGLDEADYSAYLEAAQAYNEKLAEIGSASLIGNSELVDEEYWDLLDITGTGVMGYITIDRINVQLPIYHGTDANVLAAGAGHLEGTSLPTGGESTHSVISAHRGLPGALLFTNLDKLEAGDTFTISVLDQVLTYEVDQITIVEPNEIENLYIEEGRDYCTLMTCTPYGINTHRLLVRGVRIETVDNRIQVSAEAYRVNTLIVAALIAVPLLVILLIWLLAGTRRRKN
ncbi:MAG: class C sortase [Lachnospiraceae bacterium]|nr:class C sortase [Lachnospiraceae bacterium]